MSETINEGEVPFETSLQVELEKIAAHGRTLVEVGTLLQNPESTVSELMEAAMKGFLRIDIKVTNLFNE